MMVELKIELSENQIQMLMHCIEGALDTNHVPEEEREIVKEILEQLGNFV